MNKLSTIRLSLAGNPRLVRDARRLRVGRGHR